MMPIDEAVAVLKKSLACRIDIYCNTYCTECEHWDTHNRKIAALEAAIAHIEKDIERKDGENHEQKI